MVVRTVFPSSSARSLIRKRKSSRASLAFKLGNSAARFLLHQRHRAYLSLSVGMPWQQRLELANAARKRNAEARAVAKQKADSLRPYMESTRDDL